MAGFEYYRFVQSFKRGASYVPRTALLAVTVAFILAILGIIMAAYLIMISM